MSKTKKKVMPERQPCGICHISPHRYGTTDPEHAFDAMGCVNMLLPLVEELRAALAEAIDEMEDMVSYVPDYFRKKWDHDGAIERAKTALARVTAS